MAQSLPVPEKELSIDQRVADLISRLTLDEKISQMMHESPAIERLGIPAYNWWNEACHGVGRNGKATVFPQVIGLGATWNRELVHHVADVISDEARAKHHAAVSAGRRGQYQGLSFWTPNVNIFRDPRWGRGQETFGEDPYLSGELGVAMVRGLQGNDPRFLKTAACAKHFAVHSGPEHERHTFDARPTPKDLRETYLPAFEKLVRAGVEAVMGAYNRTLGAPCCGSPFLLQETLRAKWGFKGHVVSDCGAVDDFHEHHKVTRTAAESAALAVNSGCDLNCGRTYTALHEAVDQGLISEAQIDVSLGRVLATRFRLGLFDPDSNVPWSRVRADIVDSAPHRNLARQAAVESIVLLKNNGVLPIPAACESILVAGPTAANVPALLGNYFGFSSRLVTFAEGIFERAPESCRMVYRTGCPISGPMAPGVNYTFSTAAEHELTVVFLGLDPSLEGEEGDTVASPTGGDRDVIELPKCQTDFLLELRKYAKKLVVVLTGGSAIAVPELHDMADAVLQVWYPGCEGGRALADVLFGDASPSGRMPVTVPRSTADLPSFRDYGMRGRTYRYCEKEPLYPFGFGLGYALVRYENAELSSKTVARNGSVVVRVTLENSSPRQALETVQCYVSQVDRRPDGPKATLVDFKKVPVGANSRVAVEFRIPSESFLQIDSAGNPAWIPGRYEITVGGASPGPRAVALGAPLPSQVMVVAV